MRLPQIRYLYAIRFGCAFEPWCALSFVICIMLVTSFNENEGESLGKSDTSHTHRSLCKQACLYEGHEFVVSGPLFCVTWGWFSAVFPRLRCFYLMLQRFRSGLRQDMWVFPVCRTRWWCILVDARQPWLQDWCPKHARKRVKRTHPVWDRQEQSFISLLKCVYFSSVCLLKYYTQ